MTRLALLAVVAACGGGHKPAATYATQPPKKIIGLAPTDVVLDWYRVPVPCGQGPYEVELPASDNTKYDELVELRLHSPRGVALHAVLLVDGAEVARTQGTYDLQGANARVD